MNQSQFAKLLGISQQRVAKLIQRGVLNKAVVIIKRGSKTGYKIDPVIGKKEYEASVCPRLKRIVPEMIPDEGVDELYSHSDAVYLAWKAICAGFNVNYEVLVTDQLYTKAEIYDEILKGIDVVNESIEGLPEAFQDYILTACRMLLGTLGMPSDKACIPAPDDYEKIKGG